MAGQDDSPEKGPKESPRLPYEAPAIAWQETLEARPGLLAICQKVPGQGGDCDAVDGGFS